MRSDYSVLRAKAEHPQWTEELARTYAAGGYDGVSLRVGAKVKAANLDVVHQLTGLRYLEVLGRVRDDSAAFHVHGLHELILATRSKVPIPYCDSTDLVKIGIDDRPGKERLGTYQSLRHLLLWNWSGHDFSFLNSVARLLTLHVEGAGQVTSIDGIEACAELVDLELHDVRVVSLQPLAALAKLRKAWIIGNPKIVGEPVLDLSAIAGLGLLEELRLTFAGSVESVGPLSNIHALRDVRLRGTTILDDDLTVLTNLAKSGTVVMPQD